MLLHLVTIVMLVLFTMMFSRMGQSLPTGHFSVAGYLSLGPSPGYFSFRVVRDRKRQGNWQLQTRFATQTDHGRKLQVLLCVLTRRAYMYGCIEIRGRRLIAGVYMMLQVAKLNPPKSFRSMGIEGAFDIPSMSLEAVVELIDTGAAKNSKKKQKKHGWFVLNETSVRGGAQR